MPAPSSPTLPAARATFGIAASASPGNLNKNVAPSKTLPAYPSPTQPTFSLDNVEDVEGSQDAEAVHIFQERWVDMCNGCKPSTGATSFLGATRSLTDQNCDYPKAKPTCVKTTTKKTFWTDDCLTTVTKKVKKTMYVLWVREEAFASEDDD
ncbi:hypothetical protein P389DRAFT_195135 [Cystobasidium minutum MCA 4210]|uniref:uncharacterized protein n=1 Tax=Cystobasidium minutum MCA 4210 TaxID=1397322 RepID=UPI0034CF2983|eukprot:jgi/Rhomi1/195135/gm1.3349_g